MTKKTAHSCLLLWLLSLVLSPSAETAATQAAAPPAAASATPENIVTPASVVSDTRKSSPTMQQWVHWLAPTLPPHTIEWLRDGTVFSLYFPQQLPSARGAVLLVPAAGQHAAWPDHIRALSTQLPAHGWNVLVVTPAKDTPAPPASGPAQPSAPPADAMAAPGPGMLAVLRAGLALLERKGLTNTIVIGMGDSGMAALELVHKDMGSATSVHGLVLADLPALARPVQKLAEIFRLHPVAVLDISHPAGQDSWRLRSSQLKQFPQYYAVLLPEPLASIQQGDDRFARRVRGWLARHADSAQKTTKVQTTSPPTSLPSQPD